MLDERHPNVEKIRTLNDLLRTTLTGGSVQITYGIQCLGQEAMVEILQLVKSYPGASFESGNDPYREHDFGIVSYRSKQIYWKIDYFDTELKQHSEDPSDASLTHRVLTIMLSNEY
jgi:hypothetical protein